MQLSIFSSEELPASPSALQDLEKDWQIRVATSCLPLVPLLQSIAPSGWFGRTSPASCHQTEDGILEPSSGCWVNSGMGSPTGFSTLSTLEFHSGAVACSLLDILEAGNVPQRFFLSATACRGILRRAEKRGKDLPIQLHQALQAVAGATRHAGTDGSGHQVGKGHGMGIGDNGDPMFTLGSDRHAVAFVHQAGGTQTTLGYDQERGTAPTLSKCQTVAVAFEPDIMGREGGHHYEEISGTLRKEPGDNQMAVATAMQVRRLTPQECERLQGFPDEYTQVPYRNKPAADGPRYKALGNSMAVPCMAWIGKRIQQVESI